MSILRITLYGGDLCWDARRLRKRRMRTPEHASCQLVAVLVVNKRVDELASSSSSSALALAMFVRETLVGISSHRAF
eukprot:2206826-Amphidinium_carterae.2